MRILSVNKIAMVITSYTPIAFLNTGRKEAKFIIEPFERRI
jgi:hypothetical protein